MINPYENLPPGVRPRDVEGAVEEVDVTDYNPAQDWRDEPQFDPTYD